MCDLVNKQIFNDFFLFEKSPTITNFPTIQEQSALSIVYE